MLLCPMYLTVRHRLIACPRGHKRVHTHATNTVLLIYVCTVTQGDEADKEDDSESVPPLVSGDEMSAGTTE